jgi:hypothetical protein
MRRSALLSFMLLLVFSCKPANNDEQQERVDYFDIKRYFEAEIARLGKLRPVVEKTVGINGVLETRQINVENWKQELSAFSDAEINRASWKGLFVVSKTDTTETYSSDNEKVPVQQVKISLRKGEVYKLLIVVRNTNMLYTSADSLTYYPGKFYLVKKQQNIRFLAKKNFVIEGKFR